MMKAMAALMNRPKGNFTPSTVYEALLKSPVPRVKRPISGTMNALLKPVTTAVKAAPTARPMAMEMTFPRRMKSLKPFSTALAPLCSSRTRCTRARPACSVTWPVHGYVTGARKTMPCTRVAGSLGRRPGLRAGLRGREEGGGPPEVVVERDHHVDGHDDGEPAEAGVDGRGEDRDLGEEADDARRQAREAEQEEAHGQGGQGAGGVQAAVVAQTVAGVGTGDEGGHGEGTEVHDGVHQGVGDGGADLLVAGVRGGGDRDEEVAGLADGRPGEEAYGAAGAGRRLAECGDVADGHGEGGQDGQDGAPHIGVGREADHRDEDQPRETHCLADDREVGGDGER